MMNNLKKNKKNKNIAFTIIKLSIKITDLIILPV
jgi:hypothetical protein